jgi:SpoVK/Ycf46/Vps4 family AAA+-type ATPase
MTEKLYNVAGIATDSKGNTKVRYANNLQDRIKVLLKNNFTNVKLIQLDDAYEKYEIAQILLNMTEFDDYKDIISQEIDKINRIEQQYSIKLLKKQRKLALANITAEEVLEIIK